MESPEPSTMSTGGRLLLLVLLLLLQFVVLVPLLAWPAAAIASAMMLAAPLQGNEPFALELISRSFAILCLVYPAPAIGGSMATWRAFSQGNTRLCILWALLPVVILGVIGLLALAWFLLS